MSIRHWLPPLALVAACSTARRDAFVDKLEPPVVALLCDHDRPADRLPSYYRQCFAVDEAQCTVAMQRIVHACARQLVRGDVDETNAGKLATDIGACAGLAYDAELDQQGKRISSSACDTAREAYAKPATPP